MSKPKSDDTTAPLTFEQALAQLEQTVAKLEDGQIGLDESLKEYETGVQHLKRCYDLLQTAERKIEILSGVSDDGTAITERIDESSHSGEDEPKTPGRRKKKTPSKSSPSPNDVDFPKGLF